MFYNAFNIKRYLLHRLWLLVVVEAFEREEVV